MADLDDIFGVADAGTGSNSSGAASSAAVAGGAVDEFAPKSALDAALDEIAPRKAPAPATAVTEMPTGAPAVSAEEMLPETDPLPAQLRTWSLKMVRAYLKKKKVDTRACVEKHDFVDLAESTAEAALAQAGIRTGTRMGADVARGPGAMDKLDAWDVTGFGGDKPRESEHVKRFAARDQAQTASLAAYDSLRQSTKVSRLPVPLMPAARLSRLLPAAAAAASIREVGLQHIRDCWTALTPTAADMSLRTTALMVTAAVKDLTHDIAAAAAMSQAAEGWRKAASQKGALRTAAGMLPYRDKTVVGPRRAFVVLLRPEVPASAVLQALRRAAAAQGLAVTGEVLAAQDSGRRAVLVMQQRVRVPSAAFSEMQSRLSAVAATATTVSDAARSGASAAAAGSGARVAVRLAGNWVDALPPGSRPPVEIPPVTPLPGLGAARQDAAPAPVGIVSDADAAARDKADAASDAAAARAWSHTVYVNSVTALMGLEPNGHPVLLLVTARFTMPAVPGAKPEDDSLADRFGPLMHKTRPGGRVMTGGVGGGGGGAEAAPDTDMSGASGIGFALVPALPGYTLRRAGPIPQLTAPPSGADEAAWPKADAGGTAELGAMMLPQWTAVRATLARPVPVDAAGKPRLDDGAWAADGFPSATTLKSGGRGRPLSRVEDETVQLAVAIVASARAPVQVRLVDAEGVAPASDAGPASGSASEADKEAGGESVMRCVLAEGSWTDAIATSKADFASSRGEEAVLPVPVAGAFDPHPSYEAAVSKAVERGGADRIMRRVACADATARVDEWRATQFRRLLLPATQAAGTTAAPLETAPRLEDMADVDVEEEEAILAAASAPDSELRACAREVDSRNKTPAVQMALDLADVEADEAAEAASAFVDSLSSAARGGEALSAADLRTKTVAESSRARSGSTANAVSAAAAAPVQGGSAHTADSVAPEATGLTIADELVAEVYARALTKCRIASAAAATVLGRAVRRWRPSERSAVAVRVKHCRLRREAAFRTCVNLVAGVQACLNEGKDRGMLELAMGGAASTMVGSSTDASAAQAAAAVQARAGDYRLLRDEFGVRGEAVLVGCPAASGSRSGRIVVTPRRLVYHASLLGFTLSLDLPVEHIFAAVVGESGMVSSAPLHLVYFDAAKAKAAAEKDLAAGASAAVQLDALAPSIRSAFEALPAATQDRVVRLGGPQFLAEISLGLGGPAPPPAASISVLISFLRQARLQCPKPPTLGAACGNLLGPSDPQMLRMAAEAGASTAAKAAAATRRRAASGAADPVQSPVPDTDFLGGGDGDVFADATAGSSSISGAASGTGAFGMDAFAADVTAASAEPDRGPDWFGVPDSTQTELRSAIVPARAAAVASQAGGGDDLMGLFEATAPASAVASGVGSSSMPASAPDREPARGVSDTRSSRAPSAADPDDPFAGLM